MNIRHLMVTGLSTVDLDQGALRRLLDQNSSRARLVSSFPATVAAQEATLLTGAPPVMHGVLFAGEATRMPSLIGAWHTRIDMLVEGRSFDELEERLRDELGRADLVLVSGCPTGDRTVRVVDPLPVAPAGFRLRIDDTFILCEAVEGGTSLPPGAVDEWLRTPGIERVLAPSAESSGAWMGPVDRGWILVAERGWAFRETTFAFGRIDPQRPGVLLALGRRWPAAWPEAVHDWRIAPTILAAAGEDAGQCNDTPIDGADRLEG